MTKKTRTILFSILLLLFLLITPTIILYSQGFRFDFGNKKFTRTGGLFLNISPRGAEIFLDGKSVKKTDVLFGSVFLRNILPKKYTIKIEKEGYHTWEKTLEIKETEVTEARNIILFPKNINFETLEKKVNNFWLSPDEKKIIFYEISESGWNLKLQNLEKNTQNILINERGFGPESVNLLNLEFSPDSREIYLTIGIGGQEKIFVFSLESLSLLGEKEEKLPENVVSYQNVNNDVYYLDSSGYLFKSDKSFNLREKLNVKPFQIEQGVKYSLKVFRDFIFLKGDGKLYLFDRDSKTFERFFEEIADLKISPDNKILAYSSNSEIWVLFLEDKTEQPTKKRGEKLFLTRLSEKIGNLSWINSNYLIFSSGNNAKIIEIDDRDKINALDLFELSEPKMSFSKREKKIYVLSRENLYTSTPLF